jgi:3-phenylpropionate/trans-cinnamate dioxygenase ferredoxin component
MTKDGFEHIASIDDVSPLYPKSVMVEDCEIVLFRHGNEVFAIENLCPHQHYSVLHQSSQDGYTIACPMHGWSFDLRSGKPVNGSGRVKTFEVQIRGNEVWVKVPDLDTEFSSLSSQP